MSADLRQGALRAHEAAGYCQRTGCGLPRSAGTHNCCALCLDTGCNDDDCHAFVAEVNDIDGTSPPPIARQVAIAPVNGYAQWDGGGAGQVVAVCEACPDDLAPREAAHDEDLNQWIPDAFRARMCRPCAVTCWVKRLLLGLPSLVETPNSEVK